jgi:hypothetical protein
MAALFSEREHARAAIDDLRAAGFQDDEVGFVFRDAEGKTIEGDGKDPDGSGGETAMDGALTGGIAGGVLGAVLGASALVIPGVGPFVAAGLFISVATGAGIGAVGGGLVGYLIALGFEDAEANRLHAGIEAGHVLVTVNALNREAEAKEILLRHGGDLGPAAIKDAETLDHQSGGAELL